MTELLTLTGKNIPGPGLAEEVYLTVTLQDGGICFATEEGNTMTTIVLTPEQFEQLRSIDLIYAIGPAAIGGAK